VPSVTSVLKLGDLSPTSETSKELKLGDLLQTSVASRKWKST